LRDSFRDLRNTTTLMNLAHRFSSRAWMIILLVACGFLCWTDYGRMQRAVYVSGVAGEDAVVDPTSPTGYADGKRWLIVPEHNNHSYQWVAETQQMLARDEWRVRRTEDENAPYGREVHSASPYRWWLAMIAWCDHAVSGRPLGLSVERAALFADPLLHLLLLAGASIFVARRFGSFPAAILSLGLATVYPLAAAFLPGVPDDYGLSQVCALWSVLLLLAGIRAIDSTPSGSGGQAPATGLARAGGKTLRWFFFAGVAGGCGLWMSAADQLPIIGGIALGAALATWITRNGAGADSVDRPPMMPWRAWGFGGATTCLLAYLIEYFPAHMDMQLRVNHPLYGLAWLGMGELLSQFSSWTRRVKPFGKRRNGGLCALAAAAVVALPVAMALSVTRAFIAGDLLASRLTNLPDGVVADSFAAWITRDGFTATVGATCLPLLLLGLAAWLLVRRETRSAQRSALALALGPVLVTLALAFFKLRWWNMFDGALLVLVVAATAAGSRRLRWVWSGVVGLVLVCGLVQLMPPAENYEQNQFTRAEIEGLYERALSHWIADRAGPEGAVVLVPPYRTASFNFYGGLRGLGTQNWENLEGLLATLRIASATRSDETLALINQRGITHIVVPSWDPDFENLARVALKHPEDSFMFMLRNRVLFNWLQPLPYNLPPVAGFEGQSVTIFKVTDETDWATVACRLAEYFAEMQQFDSATRTIHVLRRYPANLGALVAIAQVEKANADATDFVKDFNALVSNLSSGSDRTLAWDRRVSLAVVLALGGRKDLAREQVLRCLREIDAPRIRSLTTGALYHLQVLCKAYGLEISDQRLRELAVKLLPDELRSRL